jgi:hypothetical protein
VGDILQALLAEIDEFGLDPPARLPIGVLGKADRARIANPFEARGDVDPVAQDVLAVDENVAEIDADAIENASGLGNRFVALGHHLLDEDGAFDRGDNGRKFEQHAVPGRLDEPSAEAAHNSGRRLAPLADDLRRPGLVLAHEARIADDVGGEDRGETARSGHGSLASLRPLFAIVSSL